MRYGRSRADVDAESGYYHCISRVVDRRLALEDEAKEHFVQLMRAYEEFCGVRVVTFCIMGNHFHIFVQVPHRPAACDLPTDEELVRLVAVADCSYCSAELEKNLKHFRETGDTAGAEALRERFFRRMWDVSAFLQTLKQRFTQWYNPKHNRTGTLWEGRFRSVLVEGLSEALATIAAYIDLNPVRAGIVAAPESYRWCGYAEAVVGSAVAREGLCLAVLARLEVVLPIEEAMAAYRRYLFEEGIAREAGDDGTPARRGFTEEQVDAALKAGGKLPLYNALRCRVRYFGDGLVFGTKEFIEKFFSSNRKKFGARRQGGARPLRYLHLPNLYTMRDLRRGVVTRPDTQQSHAS